MHSMRCSSTEASAGDGSPFHDCRRHRPPLPRPRDRPRAPARHHRGGTRVGEDTPQMRAKFLSTIPLGRFSTPEDLGNAACYLCSDEASMITGVAMEVDGGRCI